MEQEARGAEPGQIIVVKWHWPDGNQFWSCHDIAEIEGPGRIASWQKAPLNLSPLAVFSITQNDEALLSRAKERRDGV